MVTWHHGSVEGCIMYILFSTEIFIRHPHLLSDSHYCTEKQKQNSAVSSPDNYCPLAVFPIVCFEKLVLQHTNWQEHLLYFNTQRLNPRRVVCSAPCCSQCAPMTAFSDIERTLLWSIVDDNAIISFIINSDEISYHEKLYKTGAHRTIYCLTSARRCWF